MSVFEKFINKSLIWPIVFTLIIMSMVLWFSQMLRLIYLFDRNISLFEFIFTTLLILPFLVNSLLPFASIYSVLYTYNSLKVNKELVIFEVNGFTRSKLVYPVFKFCSVIAFVGIINSSFVMPWAYSSLKDKLYSLNKNFISSLVQQGVFSNISKDMVLYVDKKDSKNSMRGIIIFDYKDQNNPIVYIAESGNINISKDEISLKLNKGNRQSFGNFETKEIINFDKFQIKSSSNNLDLRTNRGHLELIIWDLLFPLFKMNGSSEKFISEGHNRILWPLMTVLLPVLSLSYFLRAEFNRKKYFLPLAKSLLIGILFIISHIYILSFAGRDLSMNKYLYINYFVGVILCIYFIKRSTTNNNFIN